MSVQNIHNSRMMNIEHPGVFLGLKQIKNQDLIRRWTMDVIILLPTAKCLHSQLHNNCYPWNSKRIPINCGGWRVYPHRLIRLEILDQSLKIIIKKIFLENHIILNASITTRRPNNCTRNRHINLPTITERYNNRQTAHEQYLDLIQ